MSDILTMPNAVVAMFQQGAFVVSIPLQDYINRIVHYMPYRSKAVQKLKHQLYPTKKEQHSLVNLPFSSNPNDIKSEWNIQVQIETATKNNLLPITGSNRGLINPFTNKQTSASQHHFC